MKKGKLIATFGKMFVAMSLLMLPMCADAQLGLGLSALSKGVKAVKGAAAKKKYEPLKSGAETALQNKDMEYIISEECLVDLPTQGSKLTGNALSEYQDLDVRIKTFLYTELHTIDQVNFCENIDALLAKASSAPSVEVKALYVDAAIGVMKAMAAYGYDVKANRSKVDNAYNSIKAQYDELPSTYKPYPKVEGADIRDPRFLHNLTGGIPDADFIIQYQAKAAEQKAAAELAAQKAAEDRKAQQAAEAEKLKEMFHRNSSSVQLYVNAQKPGTANVEKVDIANIAYGNSPININDKNGSSSIGRFVLSGNEYEVYCGTSLIGYITEECKYYDRQRNYLGYINTSGTAYDKNGYTLGEISSSTVKFKSSYKWNMNNTPNNKIFVAALCIFFNSNFAGTINVKDYYM